MRSPPVCGYPLSLHQITNHKDTNHQITKLRSPPNQKNAQPTCLQPPYFPAPTPKNYKNVTNQQIKKCAAHLSAARLFSCTKSQTTKSKNAQPTCLQPPYFPAPTPKNYKNVTNQQIKKCAAHLSAARLFSCTKLQTTKSQKCAAHQIKRMRSLPVCGCPLSLHQIKNHEITNHQITKMRSPPNQKECAAHLSAAALSPCAATWASLACSTMRCSYSSSCTQQRTHKHTHMSLRCRWEPALCSSIWCTYSSSCTQQHTHKHTHTHTHEYKMSVGVCFLLLHTVLALVQLHTAAHAQTHTYMSLRCRWEPAYCSFMLCSYSSSCTQQRTHKHTHAFTMSVGACFLLLHTVHVLVQLHTVVHAQTHTHMS